VQQSLRGGTEQDRSDKSHKGAKGDKAGRDKKQIQTSPVPVRKNSRDEEKRESRIKSYSPYAFKFFMEQHVENVIKTYQQKVSRRLQLEQEMAKVISHPLLTAFPAPLSYVAATVSTHPSQTRGEAKLQCVAPLLLPPPSDEDPANKSISTRTDQCAVSLLVEKAHPGWASVNILEG
jgi:hypothetical protein